MALYLVALERTWAAPAVTALTRPAADHWHWTVHGCSASAPESIEPGPAISTQEQARYRLIGWLCAGGLAWDACRKTKETQAGTGVWLWLAAPVSELRFLAACAPAPGGRHARLDWTFASTDNCSVILADLT